MMRSLITTLFLVLMLTPPGALTTPASAQEKPSLADEIREVLERDGVEAAQRRFDELYPEHRDEWEIDPRGFAEMGAQAMQSGDMATGQAIMRMVERISRDRMAEQMGEMPPEAMRGGPPGAAQPEAGAAEARREAERTRARDRREAERAAAVRERLGEPRSDLQRFTGIYAPPGGDSRRGLFVAVRCDGYLVVGATWGDAQDWYLRSLSELAFEALIPGREAARFEFGLGGDGRADRMNHTLEFMDTPLMYQESLEDFGWSSECVEPRGG